MLYEFEHTPLDTAQSDNTVFAALVTSMDNIAPTESDYTSAFPPGLMTAGPMDDFFVKAQPARTSGMIKRESEPARAYVPSLQRVTTAQNVLSLSIHSSPQNDSKGLFRPSRFESEPSLVSLAGQKLQTKPLLE